MLAGCVMTPLNILGLYILYHNDMKTFYNLLLTMTPQKDSSICRGYTDQCVFLPFEVWSTSYLSGVLPCPNKSSGCHSGGHYGTGLHFFLTLTVDFCLESIIRKTLITFNWSYSVGGCLMEGEWDWYSEPLKSIWFWGLVCSSIFWLLSFQYSNV